MSKSKFYRRLSAFYALRAAVNYLIFRNARKKSIQVNLFADYQRFLDAIIWNFKWKIIQRRARTLIFDFEPQMNTRLTQMI